MLRRKNPTAAKIMIRGEITEYVIAITVILVNKGNIVSQCTSVRVVHRLNIFRGVLSKSLLRSLKTKYAGSCNKTSVEIITTWVFMYAM